MIVYHTQFGAWRNWRSTKDILLRAEIR